MKNLPKLQAAAVALMGMLVAGCTSYSIQPEAKSIAFPARVPTPIPIQVAIAESKQSFSRQAGDQAAELSRRLDQSGLFEAVHYPLPPTTRPGATIELRVDSNLQRQDYGVPGTLLMLSIGKSRCDCRVDGTMVLLKGTEAIKTYSARGEAVMKFGGGTRPKGELEVTQAAAWVMQARLIEQLIHDREFLAEKLKASR
jgi:hypothetical protein